MPLPNESLILRSALRLANAGSQSPEARLKAFTQFLAKTFDLTAATFYFLDRSGQQFDRLASSALEGTVHPCAIPVATAGLGRCLARRAPQELDPAHLPGLTAGQPPGACGQAFAFPVRNRLDYGVLVVLIPVGRRLAQDERRLLELLLLGLIGVIHLTSLAEENQRKVRELSLLYQLSMTMLAPVETNRLIHQTLTVLALGTAPFFDRAMLFLLNERTGILQGMLGVTSEVTKGHLPPLSEEEALPVRWELAEGDMEEQRRHPFCREVMATRLPLDPGQNACSRAVKLRRALHVRRGQQQRGIDQEAVRRFDLQEFAVAPLIAHDRVIGVVLVDNALSRRPVQAEDLRQLQLFTNQAGLALENAMLYQRIEDADRHLQEARERLLQGERLATLGEMAANLAHEVKTPLISIHGFARRLSEKLPTGRERQWAEIICREAGRLEALLGDVLLFSKKNLLCFAPCDANQLVREAVELLAADLERHQVELQLQLHAASLPLQADCRQMGQVLRNLLTNAIEAMPGGGRLTVGVRPETLAGRRAVAISVADSGGGVPPEVVGRLFEPFYTSKAAGTGLGLPIVQTIVNNHGGVVRVQNLTGSGAEFTVVLPGSA